jgi:putative hemolysin
MNAKKAQKAPGKLLFGFWRHRVKFSRVRIFPAHPASQPVLTPPPVNPRLKTQPYSVSLAQTDADRRAAFRLRFQVFNLEMKEGLESSYTTGEDTDPFDAVCDHLVVRYGPANEIVGTYRLQTGAAASRNLGYYSAQEFDFAPYESLRSQIVELGRACIHPDHRKYEVLMLLWKGIARYAKERNARYLIGCSSVSSQDAALGSAMYEKLKPMLVAEELRTLPQEGHRFPFCATGDADANPPKLLKTYITVGARICGPPAIDREFRTIDFLTLIDLNSLTPAVRSRLIES